MSKVANEPPVDRPPVTADAAPPGASEGDGVPVGVSATGARQTRIAGLKIPTESLRAYSMLFALVVIWLVFHWLSIDKSNPYGLFLTGGNLSNLFKQMAVTGVLAVGMLMIIVAGQIDLSVGSVLGLAGAAAAVSQGRGLAFSLAAAVVVGLLIGALHGTLVAYANIPAFIVTLGGMLAWSGVTLGLLKGATIPLQSPTFISLGTDLLAPVVGIALAVLAVAVIAWQHIGRNLARK
jgi:D-xylose transport system permease protein